jgi:hypothetical protein
MKQLTSILFILLICTTSRANTFYDQLCEFNFNWRNYPLKAPSGVSRIFTTDAEYVHAHLGAVIPILESNSTALLTKDQLAMRETLIRVLKSYRDRGLYPINEFVYERVPVFIDNYNTYCAVGYLMQQSGWDELARRISADNNLAWVKDIRIPEVLDWQGLSGFTLDELKLIQGAYDYYDEMAFYLENRFETPQKPECALHYFEDMTGVSSTTGEKHVWLHGEGKDGVLHGKWIQNFSTEFPWIIGFYEYGKRTGQWAEYYPGTKQLCRTENWRNDKLNGVRKRFDREGKLVEEIHFKDGVALTKTNFDLVKSLTYVRKPLDSNTVYTEVYTSEGGLLACGNESIYNPSNLLWFQNIELTALNSAAIISREMTTTSLLSQQLYPINDIQYTGRRRPRIPLSFAPQLVEYKKEGTWKYYKNYNLYFEEEGSETSMMSTFERDYGAFSEELYSIFSHFGERKIGEGYDSIEVKYIHNDVFRLLATGKEDYANFVFDYFIKEELEAPSMVNYGDLDRESKSKSFTHIGELNRLGMKIGVWKYFDKKGQHVRSEEFIVPREDEEWERLRAEK